LSKSNSFANLGVNSTISPQLSNPNLYTIGDNLSTEENCRRNTDIVNTVSSSNI